MIETFLIGAYKMRTKTIADLQLMRRFGELSTVNNRRIVLHCTALHYSNVELITELKLFLRNTCDCCRPVVN
jgi:hypothetical protein